MIFAKLATAKTLIFGPVLDSAGAEYTSAVIGDVKIAKNNGTPAALNGSATLTHKEVGIYELVLTTSDISAVGVATITLSKTTYVAPPVHINVLPAVVYDALIAGTDNLQTDLTAILNTTLTETVGGYLAAAFKKLFDVATPVLTAASVNQTIDNPTVAAIADAVLDEAKGTHAGVLATVAQTGADADTLETLSDQLDTLDTVADAILVDTGTTLPAQIAAGGGGSGAISTPITITDGVNPLDGVLVWVTTDSAGTNTVASGYTNTAGLVTFMLDAGAYFVWQQLASYNFTNPQNLSVV
jgi:hypothetical protein